MWSGWAEELVTRLRASTGRDLSTEVFAMLGYDPVAREAQPGGALVATPMARLHDLTAALLAAAGLPDVEVRAAMSDAWHAPDPVTLAHPLVDMATLLGGLRASGRRIAIATSDDREPTVRTLRSLALTDLVDAVVCADDGVANKPLPDPVLHLCARLGVAPARAAVVGDSRADIAMGRAAGAGLVVGVRTGIGTDADLAGADIIVDSVAAFG